MPEVVRFRDCLHSEESYQAFITGPTYNAEDYAANNAIWLHALGSYVSIEQAESVFCYGMNAGIVVEKGAVLSV